MIPLPSFLIVLNITSKLICLLVYVTALKLFIAFSFHSGSTTTPFECPDGTMTSVYDRNNSPLQGIKYDIELIRNNGQTRDISNQILKPSSELCRRSPMKFIITPRPGPRSNSMLISLRVKKASTVQFTYTYSSGSSSTQTVSECSYLVVITPKTFVN